MCSLLIPSPESIQNQHWKIHDAQHNKDPETPLYKFKIVCNSYPDEKRIIGKDLGRIVPVPRLVSPPIGHTVIP
jgi:hypothetical protein